MPDIHGNIEGVRKSTLAELQTLYDFPIERDEYLPIELARLMGRYSCALNREISLYITRDGEIIDITVGDTASVPLCDIRLRRSARRLSCVRCVHTHPRGSAELSDVDITALKSLLLDSMCALGISAEGEVTGVQAAFLHERVNGEPQPVCTPILSLRRLPQSAWMDEIVLSDQRVMQGEDKAADDAPERALLVGIESDESLDELADLAESAGAVVVGRSFQRKTRPDTATYIGSGKANELALDAQALEADIIIVDDELTGAQLHNLEDIVGVKVVDRTTLILDIFAQRAKTAEGRLQVSLAQLKYQSGRLIGQGLVLSRLAGGIGTRGPGESKLEMNRRHIRERMTELRRRLDVVEKQRELRRKSREKNEIPVVALVGYTNAGKSTLLNQMTGSNVYVQDQLFATLDAVSRRIETAEHTPFLLVDTVGFIRKLPHALVSAFRSTLEEAVLADVLVIVNDGASEEIMQQHDTVVQVLSDLGATEQPRIEVINKCDLYTDEAGAPMLIPGAVRLSAKTGEGIAELHARIAEQLQKTYAPVTFVLPFDRFGLVGQIRPLGRVVNEEYTDTGLELTVVLANADRDRLVSKYGKEILKG